MSCHHAGKELVWEVIVPVPAALPSFTYKYTVVDENLEAVKWSSHDITVALPANLEDGDLVEVWDEWQVSARGGDARGAPRAAEPGTHRSQPPPLVPCAQDSSHPAHALSSSAFTQVILAQHAPVAPLRAPRLEPAVNEAIVRFQIWQASRTHAAGQATLWALARPLWLGPR
jgi:hypothetical protein